MIIYPRLRRSLSFRGFSTSKKNLEILKRKDKNTIFSGTLAGIRWRPSLNGCWVSREPLADEQVCAVADKRAGKKEARHATGHFLALGGNVLFPEISGWIGRLRNKTNFA